MWPDIVFSGHVHNYQRFSKHTKDGKNIPYIVAGAGGYVTLFPVIQANQKEYSNVDPLLKEVHLETYCDDAHGFLKVAIKKKDGKLRLQVEYYVLKFNDDIRLNPGQQTNSLLLFDCFEVLV